MIIQLKEITDNSWLVITEKEQEKIGLLSACRNGTFILLSKSGKAKFENKKDVTNFFEENIFDNIIITALTTETNFTISSYPVDFDHPFEADSENKVSDLPLYTKTKASKIYHCAGYYCIKFPKGWTSSFSPKLSTLQKYKYGGPWKTEMEMKSNLSVYKKNNK